MIGTKVNIMLDTAMFFSLAPGGMAAQRRFLFFCCPRLSIGKTGDLGTPKAS